MGVAKLISTLKVLKVTNGSRTRHFDPYKVGRGTRDLPYGSPPPSTGLYTAKTSATSTSIAFSFQ